MVLNEKYKGKVEMRSFSNFCFNKVGAMLASLLLGGFVSVKAQTIEADVETACDGEAIVLTASGFPATVKAVDFHAIVGGVDKLVQTATYSGGVATAVYDMTSDDVIFYAQGQNGGGKSSNTTVTVNTDCPNKCHQSSTGEYINGTDFDVSPNNYTSAVSYKPAKDAKIESHFADYDVKFTINDCGSDPAVTNDVGSYLGYLPKDNSSQYSNYYWVSDSKFSEINCAPFTFSFHMYGDSRYDPIWDEKYYRLAMKVYIVKQKGCFNCSNAQIKLETGSGSQGNFFENADHMEIIAYDDKTGTQLGEPFLVNKSFDAQNIGNLLCKEEFDDRLVRLEIHFYGKFTLANKNANVWFSLSPRFQQLGCMKMAVDYVSAEIMSVCMSKSSSCIGEDVHVVAAGFPYGANYVWEYKDGTQWKPLNIGGVDIRGSQWREVDIPVEMIGKRNYRVYDSKTVGSSSEYIEFTITGKNCEPIQPTEIEGPVNPFCIPNTRENGKFSVSPLDANPNVSYTWSFKSPSGKEFGSSQLSFSGGGLEEDTRGGSVYLTLNGDAEEGEYTVTVQPVLTEYKANGEADKKPKGNPISKTFFAYKTPKLRIIKEGTDPLNQDAVEVCPTDDQQKFVAVADPEAGFSSIFESKYVYKWLSGATGKKETADIVIDAATCSGAKANHSTSLVVEIEDVGCPNNLDAKWKYGRHVPPTMECVNKNLSLTLAPDEAKKDIKLDAYLPAYTVGCETNPRVSVTLDFTPVAGAPITKDINIREKELATTNFNVSLPAGAGTITYKVTDGCGDYASCVVTIKVIDNTPPEIDCDAIPSYSALLTNQDGCEAAPNYYSEELPELTAPQLTDKNGVDGKVTGVYEGRTQANPNVIPQPTEAYKIYFSKSVGLNDPYAVGTTYIMWSFTDASNNTSYCIQKVTVVDDRKPVITCPEGDMGDFRTNEGECGLSLNFLMAQMNEKGIEKPSAYDPCSGNNTVLVPTIYYHKITDKVLTEIPESDWDKIIFDKDVDYELVWRFFKTTNKNVWSECLTTFIVKDQEAPEFDCTKLQSVRVTSNLFKPKDEGFKYLDYATKANVTIQTPAAPGRPATTEVYTGTLASYFADGVIRMLDGSEATDNCNGNIKVSVELYGPKDTKGTYETKEIKTIKDLEDHQFFVGLTTITYTFTDEDGNSTSCTQNIIVTAGTTPIPDCPASSDTTLYVDGSCEVEFVLDKVAVPTAKIPVNQEGCYMELHYAAISGLHFGQTTGPSGAGDNCEDAATVMGNLMLLNVNKSATVATPPAPMMPPSPPETHDFGWDYFCEQFTTNWSNFRTTRFNVWDTWLKPGAKTKPGHGGKVLEASNSLTTDSLYVGYPFEVELVDSTNKSIVKVLNPYGVDDKADARIIVPRVYDGSDNPVVSCRKAAHVCSQIDVKTQNNFEAQIMKQKLTRGEYRLIWRFQDKKGSSQQDSCVITITVKDSIKPVVTCGDWAKSGEFAANADCVVPVEEVAWFKKPTPADLNAKDNCTAQKDLIITWERKYKEWVEIQDVALTNPFQMGTTTINWYIEDISGNKTSCKQEITVVDKTGPVFDCESLHPITPATKDQCYAEIDDVIAAGLSKLSTEDDKCSPTGGLIWASYTRSDSTAESPKRVFEDTYPVGTTVITWTFTDAAGNTTVCTQNVIVSDTTAPVFDCSAIENVTIKLDPNECTASKEKVLAALGSYTAVDNCEGNIEGVPMVQLEDLSLVPLYDEFDKDTTYHIVWVFVDSKDNKQECNQMLTIEDVTPPNPEDVCPTDPNVNVDATVTCSVNFSDLNLKSVEEMAIVDPCDGKLIPTLVAKVTQLDGAIVSYVGEEAETATYPIGDHKVLYIYEDKAGLKDTCTLLIHVIDKIKPVLEDCEVETKVHLTVSGEICAVDPADVKALIVEPKAYDECDDLLGNIGQTWLTPVVKRFKIDSTAVTDGAGVILSYKYDTTMVADGVTKMWDEDVFPKGLTMLTWIFTDKTGNQDSCSKDVIVYDHTPPYFDCDKINPDTIRPIAPLGSCEYEFKLLREEYLDKLHYKAYDVCTGDSIPGVLTLNGDMPLPDEYTMKVGIVYKLLWSFKDEDGNRTTCPQWILPSHRNPVDFDCKTLKDNPIVVKAKENECFADPEDVKANITVPEAKDACTDYVIVAKPFFVSDKDTTSIDLETQKFATGDTVIHWMFLSVWNVFDTLWCQQTVSVLGNKKFDFDCSEVSPTVLDTIENCLPSESALLKVKTPWVPDPCADPADSVAYKRYGHGIRLDSTAANPVSMKDPYPLGTSKIKWIFTDFTNTIKDSCEQIVNVRTNAPIDIDCDKLKADTIKSDYEVEDGVCAVEASKILPDSADLVVPEAKHPCLENVGIEVHSRRKGGKSWNDDYIVGINWIEWIFIDTSHTTINDTLICEQPLQVGKDNATLFDCKAIKPIRFELDESSCTVDTVAFNLSKDVPLAYDACGDFAGQLIKPILTRTSGKAIDDVFTVGKDTIVWTYHYKSLDDDVVCPQPVHVLDSKKPIFDCSLLPDTTLAAEQGKCYLQSKYIKEMLDELQSKYTAVDACVDTIKIPGKYDASVIPDVLNVGDTITIHWVFQNEEINLSKKECDHTITVIGDMAPIFECESLPLDTFKTYACDTVLTENEIKTPIAKDACTGTDVKGVGVRLDGGELYGSYPAGVTTQIKWTFTSAFSKKDTFCIQDIHVLTYIEPIFDCSTLDTIRLASLPGECYIDSSAVADNLSDHYAKDSCTGTMIKGVPSAYDGGSLPEKYMVGDTTLIKWTFIDSSLNVNAKICYQAVVVTGDQKPIFDCESLVSEPILIEGCDTTLSEQTIKIPYAEDACTGDSIPGVGERLDGGELYGIYPVGTTTIRWVFVSPFSSAKDTCNQDVTILTKKEIVFDCDALAEDTVQVNVATGECEAVAELPTQIADHPCPEQSGVTKIKGIPTFNGEALTANADSTVWSIKLPTGVWNVTWTFTDHSATMVDSIKSCTQPVRIGDVNEMPVKCENYPDTLIKLSPMDCEISWSEINFNAPDVVDLCSNQTIEPDLTRSSGKTMDDPFVVGVDTVFWSYSFSGQDVMCKQVIHVLDSVAPIFDCSTLTDIQLYAKEGTCEVSSEELVAVLGEHVAVDSCSGTEIPGKAFVDGVSVEKVTAKVGDTLIVHWVFIDSMINAVAKECDQNVFVYGQNKPIFDCSSLKDTILYLALDECVFDGTKLTLDIPVAKDSCTGQPVPGVASRQDGEDMTATYQKGVTVVDWTFKSPLSTAERTCPQNVVVKDTLPPAIDCTVLKDTVKVKITDESVSDNSVTAAEAEAAGLVTPTFMDKCDGEIIAVGHRDDGKTMDDPYLLNAKTTVTWVYTDASGNSDSCKQVVVVEDWVLDELTCPNDINDAVQCVENLPAAYASYEEFKLAGGLFSNESKIMEGSFKVLSDDVPANEHCDFYVVRTYQVTDVRNNDIQCKQKIHVVDNVAPTLSERPLDIKLACTDEIPEPIVITAVDDCKPTAVDVVFKETSNRSTDPNSCEYYNYTITRYWTATDICDNATKDTQYVVIVDTLSPEFNFPEGWKDTVLSIYNKGCTFGVPDFTVEVRSIVSDNCTDVTNIKVTQIPAPGTLITTSTNVRVVVEDMCGNAADLYKYVLVPAAGSIVSLTAKDTALCVSEDHLLTLEDQRVRLAQGRILVEDWDGSFTTIPTAFVYDYYRDSISTNTLVFSNNPNTYKSRFKDSEKIARLGLRKQHQSGRYWFVAMDTLTLCSDTANSFLEIKERPRISMKSGLLEVCEFNGVDSVTLNNFVRCVDDMGSAITDEGWMLNGNKYQYEDSLFISQDSSSFVYYAENECGLSTSDDTYLNFCIGDAVPMTHQDSMEYLGKDSLLNYEAFRTDDLKVRDSILLDVYDRLKTDEIFITVNDKERSTVWLGDPVELNLHSNYGRLSASWYAVRGQYDRRFYVGDGADDFKFEDVDDEEDEKLFESYIHNGQTSFTDGPRDTTAYYVVLSNGVCPSISSNVATANVNDKLPTAITPFTLDGLNDVFMKSFPVKIFNRYSQLIYEGNDGWNGHSAGQMVDPGVYFYEVVMRDGTVMQGTIEVVKL